VKSFTSQINFYLFLKNNSHWVFIFCFIWINSDSEEEKWMVLILIRLVLTILFNSTQSLLGFHKGKEIRKLFLIRTIININEY